jgi:hypothetical protein
MHASRNCRKLHTCTLDSGTDKKTMWKQKQFIENYLIKLSKFSIFLLQHQHT